MKKLWYVSIKLLNNDDNGSQQLTAQRKQLLQTPKIDFDFHHHHAEVEVKTLNISIIISSCLNIKKERLTKYKCTLLILCSLVTRVLF